ncbi:MAG: hypothetical protein SGPRY_014003 [Prymnesium sp.]
MQEELSPLQARLMATYMEALHEKHSKPSPEPPPAPPPASNPSSRSELYSKKMGELLLKGWRMQAENCPVTGEVPLMQEPSSGRSFSIAVGKFVDEIDGGGEGGGKEGEEGVDGEQPAPSPHNPSTSNVPAPSDATAAPPAPSPTSGGRERTSLAWPAKPSLPPLSAEEEGAVKRNREESERWCEHMSQLMLKGWKMLGDNCPVPLMEHPKNGRKFSVAVGKYLDELASPSPSPAPPPSPPSSPSPVPIQQEEPARLLHSDTHIEQPSLLPALAATPPIPSEAPRSAGCKRSYQGTSAIASARAAVEQQLLQPFAGLRQCSEQLIEADSPPPLQLIDAVTRCAQALTALADCERASAS